MFNKKNIVIGGILLVVLALTQYLFITSPTPKSQTATGPAPVLAPPASGREPRDVTEGVANDMSALDQLSTQYHLTTDQQQEIRRIIQSANYDNH